jgi:hypothetical protein
MTETNTNVLGSVGTMFGGPQPTGAIPASIAPEDEAILGSLARPAPSIENQSTRHNTEAKQGGKAQRGSAK